MNGGWCVMRGLIARTPETVTWGMQPATGYRNRGEGPRSAQRLTMNLNVEDDK